MTCSDRSLPPRSRFGIAALPVAAQDYPTESVNYIIPFGPGGESDITARFQQPHFQELFGEDLVITTSRAAAAPSVGRSSIRFPPTGRRLWE